MEITSVSMRLGWPEIVLGVHFVMPLVLGVPAMVYIQRSDGKRKKADPDTKANAAEAKGKPLEPLHCPSCGAPVPLEGGSFPCAHCGATVRPPDDYVAMLALRRAAIAELRRAERRWRWSRWTSSRPFTIGLRVAFLAWFVLVCAAELVVDLPHAVALLGFIVVLLEAGVGWALGSVYDDARATLPPLPDGSFVKLPAEVATCASCGGPIRFAEGELAVICGYCGGDDYREHLAKVARTDAGGKHAAAKKSLLAAVRDLDSRRQEVITYFAFIGFAEVFYVVVFSLVSLGDWMGC